MSVEVKGHVVVSALVAELSSYIVSRERAVLIIIQPRDMLMACTQQKAPTCFLKSRLLILDRSNCA
jgi:hypothetical protein